VAYLNASEVCLRRGDIQIHIYLYLYLHLYLYFIPLQSISGYANEHLYVRVFFLNVSLVRASVLSVFDDVAGCSKANILAVS